MILDFEGGQFLCAARNLWISTFNRFIPQKRSEVGGRWFMSIGHQFIRFQVRGPTGVCALPMTTSVFGLLDQIRNHPVLFAMETLQNCHLKFENQG